MVSLPELSVNAKRVGTAHLLLVVSLPLQLHFYSLYSVDKQQYRRLSIQVLSAAAGNIQLCGLVSRKRDDYASE